MYKLSVIDDEHIVLERLIKMIEKINDNNLVLESTFNNGDDAFNHLSINPPDILITDIHIPFISGIELSKMLKKINPLIKIIIITGYEELSYAKEAINLEVVGFISKPISYEELKEVIEKAKEKIEVEKSIESNKNEFNRFYKESLPVLKENYLSKLLDKNKLSSRFKEQLERVKIDLDYKSLMIGYFDFDLNYSDEEKELFETFLISQLYNLNMEFHIIHKEYDLIVLFKNKKTFNKELMIDDLKLIIAKAKRQLNIEVSIGLSNPLTNDVNYKILFNEAKNALTSRKIFGGMQVFLYSDIDKDSNRSYLIDDSNYNKLTYNVRYEQDINNIKKVLEEIKDIVGLEEHLLLYEFNLSNILNAIVKGLGAEVEIATKDFNYSNLYQQLFSFKTIDEVFDWFLKIISDIQKNNFKYIEDKAQYNMNSIINYIDNNFTDNNLNLEMLAEEVGFSISYITTLFKTNYKTTFVKYLTTIRMDKAKEVLLNTNKKIIEIANIVGYNDPYYFSHSFKKHFGLSPKEYRDEHA